MLALAALATMLAWLLIGIGSGSLALDLDRAGETAVVSASEPAALYISEVGPTVIVQPGQAATLPAAGITANPTRHWPRAAGFGLALLGSMLIYAALTSGETEAR